jgi:hypothetical protein
VVDDEGNLILWRTFPEPQDDVGRRLWDRFQIHFAVGNAF